MIFAQIAAAALIALGIWLALFVSRDRSPVPTHDLTGARLGQQTDGPLGGLYLAQVVNELSPFVLFRFTSTADRDAKFATYIADGGSLVNGMSCWCDSPGAFYDRIAGAWVKRTSAPTLPAFQVGATSITTNGSGDFTITHGLGTGSAPTAVFVQGRTVGSFGGHVFAVTSKTSTQFTARAYYNNAANTSVSIDIFWRVDA